ncbi:hypothetical protein OOU_Y34scaffold00703g30 [Pyricularia oryzae Y34]|uniref:Uncharacterized protein n=2 Tax=Pyricularia oryzae TaxID=318829 RepID=A0AA97NSN7_PYRO3|nr:hypothetical protein OOU_Y34scaffold00703g30 [Pyricularia oryzae Y34]
MFSAMMVQRGRAAIFHIYVGCKGKGGDESS